MCGKGPWRENISLLVLIDAFFRASPLTTGTSSHWLVFLSLLSPYLNLMLSSLCSSPSFPSSFLSCRSVIDLALLKLDFTNVFVIYGPYFPNKLEVSPLIKVVVWLSLLSTSYSSDFLNVLVHGWCTSFPLLSWFMAKIYWVLPPLRLFRPSSIGI